MKLSIFLSSFLILEVFVVLASHSHLHGEPEICWRAMDFYHLTSALASLILKNVNVCLFWSM